MNNAEAFAAIAENNKRRCALASERLFSNWNTKTDFDQDSIISPEKFHRQESKSALSRNINIRNTFGLYNILF